MLVDRLEARQRRMRTPGCSLTPSPSSHVLFPGCGEAGRKPHPQACCSGEQVGEHPAQSLSGLTHGCWPAAGWARGQDPTHTVPSEMGAPKAAGAGPRFSLGLHTSDPGFTEHLLLVRNC